MIRRFLNGLHELLHEAVTGAGARIAVLIALGGSMLLTTPFAGVTYADGGVKLNVPYMSQYPSGGINRRLDCGPTAVAMVAWYYGLRPAGISDEDFIQRVRRAATNNNTDDVLTTPDQLENALPSLGLSYNAISGSQDTSSAILQIANAVAAGEPVVVLINGQPLGRYYDGHWVVVTGFSSDGGTVYLNDPDQNPHGGKHSGGAIAVPLDAFYNALDSRPWNGDYGFVPIPNGDGPSGNNGGGQQCGVVGAPALLVSQQCAAIWTDQTSYWVGATAQVCFSVPYASHVVITDIQADGYSHTLYDQYDDGSGGCLTGYVTPPTGHERLHLDVYSDGQLIGSADTAFDVMDSPVG